MRYAEIVGETDGFYDLRLQAISSQLDTVKRKKDRVAAQTPKSDTAATDRKKQNLKRQQQKLKLDKARVQLQKQQRNLQDMT